MQPPARCVARWRLFDIRGPFPGWNIFLEPIHPTVIGFLMGGDDSPNHGTMVVNSPLIRPYFLGGLTLGGSP